LGAWTMGMHNATAQDSEPQNNARAIYG